MLERVECISALTSVREVFIVKKNIFFVVALYCKSETESAFKQEIENLLKCSNFFNKNKSATALQKLTEALALLVPLRKYVKLTSATVFIAAMKAINDHKHYHI
jgi:hypothetical protein